MTPRQIENLIKIGTVSAADPAANRVRVVHGALETDWLPYFVPAAGGVSVWRLPSVGEMCMVLSPSGETENAVALMGIASAQHPAPSGNPDETVVKFPDGAAAKYNHATGALEVSGIKTGSITAAASITINAPQTTVNGKLNVTDLFTYSGGMSGSGGGGTTITGNFNHNGTLTNNGRLESNGVVLDGHTHPDTTSGGNTGKPNK